MSLFEELKRRNVIRVGIAYAVGAWLLVQGADLILDLVGADDWVLRAVAGLLALGFIPAVVFAWAFEITPEGIKKEKEVDRTRSITHHTAKKLDIATMALLVGAIVLLALDRFIPSAQEDQQQVSSSQAEDGAGEAGASFAGDQTPTAEPSSKSIAVLPFVDMSPAKDNEYFTDGLTEELLNILAQIKSLQVAGRTSSFAFKGKTEDLREIGEKLNVNTLLEGSVRKDDKNQKIRVTVQLINVADGYHIWSDNYDRDLEDIFAIQEDIALQVAEALKINLLGEEETRIVDHSRADMNAYDLYLQGLQAFNLYTFEELRRAESLLQQSLAIDANYLPTKLALARTVIELAESGAMPAPEAVSRATPLLNEVLQVEPANDEAITYRGQAQELDREPKAARQSFEEALNINPRNAVALTEYGGVLLGLGRVDEALQYMHQAAGIEPYDVSVQWSLCLAYAMIINAEATLRECDRIGEIQPGNPMQAYGKGFLYEFNGDIPRELFWNIKAIELDPDDHELQALVAMAWLDLGDMEQAKDWLQRSARQGANRPGTVSARILTLLHDEQYQQALEVAQKAHDENLPSRQNSTRTINRVLVGEAVRQRDFDKAIDLLQQGLPGGLAQALETESPQDIGGLAGIAQLMNMQDPGSDQAKALVRHAEALSQQADSRRIPYTVGINLALIGAAQHDKTSAIDGLRLAIEKGWNSDWHATMHNDWRFEFLHQEPEYQELIAMLEHDMERKRLEAYELLGLSL